MSDDTLKYSGVPANANPVNDEPKKLSQASIDDLGVDDLQPGVGSASENRAPKPGPPPAR
jgi:hypothetical protein